MKLYRKLNNLLAHLRFPRPAPKASQIHHHPSARLSASSCRRRAAVSSSVRRLHPRWTPRTAAGRHRREAAAGEDGGEVGDEGEGECDAAVGTLPARYPVYRRRNSYTVSCVICHMYNLLDGHLKGFLRRQVERQRRGLFALLAGGRRRHDGGERSKG